MAVQPPGPKYISGQVDSAQLTLTRDDGTSHSAPILFTTGTLIDNGDGTWDIDLPEEG